MGLFALTFACSRAAAPSGAQDANRTGNAPIAAETPAAPHARGLTVTVTPAQGIVVELDGTRVATASPFVAADVTPGPHVLQVRGMGYHDVILPIDVPAQGMLQVPVALRPRPPVPFNAQIAPRPQPPAAAAAPPTQPGVRAQPAGPSRPPRPLPSGAVPMWLTLVAMPPAPIYVDGVLVRDEARLAQGSGMLNIGAIHIGYRIHPGRVLELVVPHDDAAWFKEDGQIKATSVLRLESRPLLLRRVDAQGTTQAASLHRLE